MSRTRQALGPVVRTGVVRWSVPWNWRSRASDWGHLLYSSHGMLTVQTEAGAWVTPPHEAVWLPARTRHGMEASRPSTLRFLYLHDSIAKRLPRECRAVHISPLLRELLREVMRLGTLNRSVLAERHLLELLLDQLVLLPRRVVELRMPVDARALQVANRIREAPAERHSLADSARQTGSSTRTLERIFRSETGVSFGVWRTRARLLRSLQLLAEDESVTRAALAVGYESTSAFVAAFRRAFGTTPGRYFPAAGPPGES